MDKRARTAPTIADLIERMARETDSPPRLVDDVRRMFSGKGISLDEDAGPYADAIRETFLSDAVLRQHTARATQELERLRERLQALQRAWSQTAEQLDHVRVRLAGSAQGLARQAELMRLKRSVVPGPRAVQ